MNSPVGTLVSGLRNPTAVTVGQTYKEWRAIQVDVSGLYTLVTKEVPAGVPIYLAAGIAQPWPGTSISAAAAGSANIVVGY